MSELPSLLIVRILEANCLGDRVDRFLWARQEMPAVGGPRPVVAFENCGLLCGRQFGRVFGIKADREDVEFFPHVKFQDLQRALQSHEEFAAKHGTAVVNQAEHQGLLSEVIAEVHGFPGLIAKDKICGDLLVQSLLDRNIRQTGRLHIRGRRHYSARVHSLRPSRWN